MPFVEHPSENQRRDQEELISQYDGPMKRSHQLFFSYGNAVMIYHREALDWVNEDVFNEYIQSLRSINDNKIADYFEKEGFLKMQTALPFTRYVRERRDEGQEKYIERLMGTEDYNEFKTL